MSIRSSKKVDASIYMPLDVQKPGELEAVFAAVKKKWGKLDIVLHSIAFAPKEDLQGRVVDCSKDGFLMAMELSCWSFIRMAKLAEPLMKDGGTLFTMTYYGSQMVVENYNIMGPVKAALESATRYMAAELGPKGIRVHAISPGPLKTRAASGISDFDKLLQKAQSKAPSRSLVSIDDVGVTVAFLAMNGQSSSPARRSTSTAAITSSTDIAARRRRHRYSKMKTISIEQAVAMIPDGARLMIGGFMGVGTPERLVDEIVRQGKRDLTVIANDTAKPGTGIGKLVSAKLVRTAIVSHIGLNPETQQQMIAGQMPSRARAAGHPHRADQGRAAVALVAC